MVEYWKEEAKKNSDGDLKKKKQKQNIFTIF